MERWRTRTRLTVAALLLLAWLAQVGVAHAEPIVIYQVSGAEKGWLLDFTVTNTLGEGFDLYLLGVRLSDANIVGAPPGHWVTVERDIEASVWGGSDTVYNTFWEANGPGVLNGRRLGGFRARVATVDPPLSVRWISFAGGAIPYEGTDSFSLNPFNPGFEGTATPMPAPLPEPSSLLLLGSGLAAVVARRWRLRERP